MHVFTVTNYYWRNLRQEIRVIKPVTKLSMPKFKAQLGNLRVVRSIEKCNLSLVTRKSRGHNTRKSHEESTNQVERQARVIINKKSQQKKESKQ
jgi:hypothetical protein